MKYILCLPESDSSSGVPLDRGSYYQYTRASNVLLHCLFAEIKYDILTSNFLDLEEQILKETESIIVRGFDRFPNASDLTISLNKRILNLLASARMYTDQIVGHVRKCLPEKSRKRNVVKDSICRERVNSWDFRFVEALRNHAQHSGLSVHWTNVGMHANQHTERWLTEYNLDFAVETIWFGQQTRQRICTDEDGKPIEATDRIHLKLPIRRYVDSLRGIHFQVRDLINEQVDESRALIEKTLHEYSLEWSREVNCLEVRKINNSGSVTEKKQLLLNWDDERIKLQSKNTSMRKLENDYVTNCPTGKE